MNQKRNIFNPHTAKRGFGIVRATVLPLILLRSAQSGFAGSTTWRLSPPSGDWNTANNWMPKTVPNGLSDIATFGVSNITNVSLSALIEVSGSTFTAGASQFSISVEPTFLLTISGPGIANNSGVSQNFVTLVEGANAGAVQFMNGATAGGLTSFTNNPARASLPAAVTLTSLTPRTLAMGYL